MRNTNKLTLPLVIWLKQIVVLGLVETWIYNYTYPSWYCFQGSAFSHYLVNNITLELALPNNYITVVTH